MHVDGVLAGDDILDGAATLGTGLAGGGLVGLGGVRGKNNSVQARGLWYCGTGMEEQRLRIGLESARIGRARRCALAKPRCSGVSA